MGVLYDRHWQFVSALTCEEKNIPVALIIEINKNSFSFLIFKSYIF